MRLLLWMVASYLLGAIPTSYLVVRVVKKQDLRVTQQCPRQSNALTQTLGQRAAHILSSTGQVDRLQGLIDPTGPIGDFVQIGETLQVLGHAQTQIQAR